jgi:hypothetical protein
MLGHGRTSRSRRRQRQGRVSVELEGRRSPGRAKRPEPSQVWPPGHQGEP